MYSVKATRANTKWIAQQVQFCHYGGEKVILESAQRNFQLILWNQSGKVCEVGPKADEETWFWCLQCFRSVFDAFTILSLWWCKSDFGACAA